MIKLDPSSGKTKSYLNKSGDPNSISDDSVTTIIEDQNGDLWVGTFAGGLNRFDKATGRFVHFYHDPDNPNSLIKQQHRSEHLRSERWDPVVGNYRWIK